MAVTVPRQFRLGESTLADLDLIAAHLSATAGGNASRADAIRAAAREMARKIGRKESGKTSKKMTR